MVFWIEGIQIYDYCITPGSPDIHQFYVQNWLYWGFPTGISNRRYSNYCLSPGIARLEHDLKMLLTIGCMFFPSAVRCFGISIIFHLKTAFLCPFYAQPMKAQNQAKNQLSSIWKVFFSTPRISSRKINSITDCLLFEKWFESPSLNQRSKKTHGFWTVFHRPTPRRRECQSTSGRVPLREVLWHSPLRGVTQVGRQCSIDFR